MALDLTVALEEPGEAGGLRGAGVGGTGLGLGECRLQWGLPVEGFEQGS